MPPLVSFTSDFGLADPYAGTVKAVMLGICPGLTIVDVTHSVQPQAVLQAVFLTQQAWPFFPSGTIHLAVVDPGVGTDRRALALKTPTGYAVVPDNGVLSAILPEASRRAAGPFVSASATVPLRIPVPDGYEARSIESPDVIAPAVSATFHGRDIFGPAAAHLAAGFPFEQIGPRCSELFALPPVRGEVCAATVRGFVIHVDQFGNLISSIHRDDLPDGADEAELLGRRMPLVRTYGDHGGLVALVGSSGYLEVAVANGIAARELNAGLNTPITVYGR